MALRRVQDLLPQPEKLSWSQMLKCQEWIDLRRQTIRDHPFCKSCRRADVVLNAHHPVYDGRKPWEYSTQELVVLCSACHTSMHKAIDVMRINLSNMNATDAMALSGLIKMSVEKNGARSMIRILSNELRQ